MGLFDRFKKDKKEEDNKKAIETLEKTKEEVEREAIEAERNRSWEEKNREREKRLEEQMKLMKENAKKAAEEKERELAAKQQELENRKRQYVEETEKSTREFFEFANREKERMQKETDRIENDALKKYTDIKDRINQANNAPGMQHKRAVAVEQYKKIEKEALLEVPLKEFKEKYKEIESAFNGVDIGIIPLKFDIEKKRKFSELTQEQKDDMFIPYFVEKISLGAAIKEDKNILKKYIRDKGKNIQEQYTSGIELLSSFGLVDITDKEMFSSSFNLYSLKTREEIKKQIELSGMFDEEKDASNQKSDGQNIK